MPKHSHPSLFEKSEQTSPPRTYTRQGLVVREVKCKSLLNRSPISEYSFNPYTGCANGCVYCYARFMQRFHPHEEPWGKFVDVKINAAEVLSCQLRRLRPGRVFTCSVCDGWQSLERRYRITRRCCRMLLEAGFGLNILTKSELVLRDLDIFQGQDVRLGVTITNPDESQARLWEPKASSVWARLEVLRQAKAAGLTTTVMFGPLLPGISDTRQALHKLFTLAAEADVDRIYTDTLNPRPRVWPSVQQLLKRKWPALYDHYQRVLFDRPFRAAYQGKLNTRIRRAAEQLGLADRLLGT